MNTLNYDVLYNPSNETYEYGNKYMTDSTIRLEKGVLKSIEYHEEDHKTSLSILVSKKEEEKNKRFNFLVDGKIRDMNINDNVHFMYIENEDKTIEFKAFVFSKEELEARMKKREHEYAKEDKVRDKATHEKNNEKTTTTNKEVKNPHVVEDSIITERSTQWKENIPFLKEGKWYKVGFENKKCSSEQLNQVFKAINDSDISSTLKIGFQSYLADLKDVKYKHIINIETEYKNYVKKAAQKAIGKSL